VSAEISVPIGTLEDLTNIAREQAWSLLLGMNDPDIAEARKIAAELLRHNPTAAYLMPAWWGRNHQHIKVGDTVRWTDTDGTLELCEVHQVYVFGALTETEVEVSWRPWFSLHRLDRLHTQPDFDVANWSSIAEHMGYSTDPSSLETGTPLFLRPRLTVVTGGA
jgi:hypothetical protein